MSEESSNDLQRCRELMSSLADGDQNSADDGCRLWATDARAREAWHTYHLIGDALRSDDLAATPPARDSEFLAALRLRLAAEPTVLAPTPTTSSQPSQSPQRATARRGWRVPAAVAAGFVAVAGALVASRTQSPGADGAPVLASGSSAAPAMPVAARAQGLGEPQWQVVDGQVIRDARLDSYLRAHRRGPIGVPGADAGRFETVVLER